MPTLFASTGRCVPSQRRRGRGIKHGGLYALAATPINVQCVGNARSTTSNGRFCALHARGMCNTSQGESDWCQDVTSTHGVQTCTGVGFLLSGDGFCLRRHGEARAGKHGAAAAALLRPRWPHATASYESASTRVMVRMFDLAPRIHCRTARGMGGAR